MLGKLGLISVVIILAAVVLNVLQPDLVQRLWPLTRESSSDDDASLNDAPEEDGALLFTEEQLRQQDGKDKPPFLAILGRVYDVSGGMQHYGPGGGYNHFAGRDASRSFVTGDFTPEGLSDDLSDFTPQQMLGIDNWIRFYDKDYKFVGRVIGRFYDTKGRPTKHLRQAKKLLETARRQQELEEKERQQFPGCNSEWKEKSGGRIWCSTRSGGIDRDWEGFPRQFFKPESGQTRCVCVHPSQLENPNLRQYPGCDPNSVSCPLPD